MASASSSIAARLVFVVIPLLLLGGFLWFQHRDAAVKGYRDGSVCGHGFDIDNAYPSAVAEQNAASSSSDDSGNGDANNAMYDAASQAAAETLQGERTEFQDIFGTLVTANQALAAAGEKPLFCSPALTPEQTAALYDSYWKATRQRIKQDLNVCRRNYSEDILIFYSRVYPCR